MKRSYWLEFASSSEQRTRTAAGVVAQQSLVGRAESGRCWCLLVGCLFVYAFYRNGVEDVLLL